MSEDELEVFVDYEVLHICQYPVECGACVELEADCGEPAMYEVFWTLSDGSVTEDMLVCQYHFDFIMKCEKNQSNGKSDLTNSKK